MVKQIGSNAFFLKKETILTKWDRKKFQPHASVGKAQLKVLQAVENFLI